MAVLDSPGGCHLQLRTMFTRIEFRNRSLRRLVFHIKPEIDFGIVLGTLEEIRSGKDEALMVHIRFALLELINNSLRAHRSRSVSDPMRLEFRIIESTGVQQPGVTGLQVLLEDHGRGFDPADLPYNIYGPASEVDLQSESFLLYRELHNQQRFGMGLFVTKRTFDRFKLEFIDFDGYPRDYSPGDIRGTRISLVHWGGAHE
jgi:anti-sigma regulatory factor (Ser/Thr protein kinase)